MKTVYPTFTSLIKSTQLDYNILISKSQVFLKRQKRYTKNKKNFAKVLQGFFHYIFFDSVSTRTK